MTPLNNNKLSAKYEYRMCSDFATVSQCHTWCHVHMLSVLKGRSYKNFGSKFSGINSDYAEAFLNLVQCIRHK